MSHDPKCEPKDCAECFRIHTAGECDKPCWFCLNEAPGSIRGGSPSEVRLTYDELVAAIESTSLSQRPALLAVAVRAAVPCFKPGQILPYVANVIDPQATPYQRRSALGGGPSSSGE